MRVRGPLALKVFAGIFGTAAVLVVAMTARSVWQIDRGFTHYVVTMELERLRGLADSVERGRQRTGDWSFIPTDPAEYRQWLGRAMGGPRGLRQDGGPGRPAAPEDDRPPPPPPPTRAEEDAFIARQGRLPGAEDAPARGDGAPPAVRPGPPERRPPPDRLELVRRVGFFDTRGVRFAGAEVDMEDCATLPLRVDGQVAGYLGLREMGLPLAEGDRAFVRAQWRDALVVGAAALLLSALVSWAFARHLRRPVGQMVEGTTALAAGDLATRLPTDRNDEFGLIAGHFNQMAARLEQLERGRREWMASTSHELRTPLTVLRALIEALQEGIRQGDAATLQRLHDQVMSLSHLVDDLYLLAQHDAGNSRVLRQTLHPKVLVEDVLDAQRPRLAAAGITATLVDHTGDAAIVADPQRLAQLVHNLVENTLRYTDAPGRLHIGLSLQGDARAPRGSLRWQAEFDDSAPGVPDTVLPRLVERFYRGEGSRSRATGGSGLGLSICRAIAEEHGGSLEVQHSSLGGLRVTLSLPVSPAVAEG